MATGALHILKCFLNLMILCDLLHMPHTSRNHFHVTGLTATRTVYGEAWVLLFGSQTVETTVPKKLRSPSWGLLPGASQQGRRVPCKEISHIALQRAGGTGAMAMMAQNQTLIFSA